VNAITLSPTFACFTPSPTSLTTPASSLPEKKAAAA
jgi:hypothetical protein